MDIVSSGWISSKGQTYPIFFSGSQLDKLLSSLQPKVSHSKGMKTWVEEQYAFVDGLGKQITFDALVKVTRKQFLKARKEDVQQIVTGVRPKHWSSTGRIPADKKLSLDEFLRLRGNGPKTLK